VKAEDFLYNKKTSNKLQWTPEKGFAKRDVNYPERAQGEQSQKFIVPMLSVQDSKNYCFQKTFSVFFHLPTEIPTSHHDIYYVNYKTEVNFRLAIKSFRSDDYLRNFSPHHRKCYFENERKLKFFKTYSKTLCEFECRINQTLRKCGCVHITMPREKSTKICDLDEIDECAKWEEYNEGLVEDQSLLPCDCYPACNDLKYEFKFNIAVPDDDIAENFNE
jgi:amiloride-sensitive sodium channel